MRIFNQDKTKEMKLEEVDFSMGYLAKGKRFVKHHEEQKEIEEVFHFETIKEYPNGGKDVKKVIDAEGVPYKEAYDEYEDIQIFTPYEGEELERVQKERRYDELKEELAKVMEDIGQEQLGFIRDDYAEKKTRAAEIINELRVLEGKDIRAIKTE